MNELTKAITAAEHFHKSLNGFLSDSGDEARDNLCDSLCELLSSLKAAFATLSENAIAA